MLEFRVTESQLYYTCSVCYKIDNFLFGDLSHDLQKNEFYADHGSLTRGQREVLKENDKCREKGEHAINNMETTPRDCLRPGWDTHHNSWATAQKAGLTHAGRA